MNRRSLVLGGAGLVLGGSGCGLLLPGQLVGASAVTPTPAPDAVAMRDTIELPELRYFVGRQFSADSDRLFPEGLRWLACFGMVFTSAEDAIASMDAFATGIHKYDRLRYADKWDVGRLRITRMRKMGDESAAWTWTNTHRESGDETTCGMSIVVQDRWMQALRANTPDGNPVVALADYAEPTLSRWPSSTPTTTQQGMNTGGDWDALPTLDDMPEGVNLDGEWAEIGPFQDRH